MKNLIAIRRPALDPHEVAVQALTQGTTDWFPLEGWVHEVQECIRCWAPDAYAKIRRRGNSLELTDRLRNLLLTAFAENWTDDRLESGLTEVLEHAWPGKVSRAA